MKFQITIKEQSEAINGKAKYPLYKASNQKTFDEDRGLQTLQELFQTSSIKIFCDQCQKEITFQTIVISHEGQHEGQQKVQSEKQQSEQIAKQKTPNEEKIKMMEKEKKKAVQDKLSRLNLNKRKQKQKKDDEIFQQKDSSDQEINEQIPSESQNQSQPQQQEPPFNIFQQNLQAKQKNGETQPIQTSREITHLYCVGCFASLEEFPQFYSIRKSLKFSPLNSSWTVFDEINLLNGLKFWGFGNWGQIREFMEYNSSLFTVNQIQSHYEQLYLKADGPAFPTSEEFDISQAHKPAKRYLGDIMHHYYFPLQSTQNVKKNQQTIKQGQKRKEKHLESGFSQNKLEISHQQSERHPVVGHSSKHLRSTNNFLIDSIHASNTSLYQLNDSNQRQNKQKQANQNKEESSESQFQEDSEQDEFIEGPLNQIQLKPKPSSHIHEGKMNGKGLKQGMSRSYNIFPEEANNSNEMNMVQYNRQEVSPSNTSIKLKGHNVYSYNPKRKQFEIIEYDYFAESMLAQLEFSQEDTQQEIQLKLKIIQEYNNRLDQRIKRREFVIQHRLLDTDFMIKTLHKYNKANFQIFLPFRKLIPKNQDYYKILDSYDKMCKASSLSQGMIKVKRKLSSTHKKPQIKHFIDYLNQKKQKKQLLGKRARYQNEIQRRVLHKQGPKTTKKTILSMSESSYSLINGQSALQQQGLSPLNQQIGQASRTMTSRSEERQRLRNNQNSMTRQGQHFGSQEVMNQNINFSHIGILNNSNSIVNVNSTGLNTLASQEDINVIERYLKNKNMQNNNSFADFKPFIIKNYCLKPLSSQHAYKN